MVEFIIYTLIMTAIFAIVALSLNLQAGITGLSNFGQAIFFAIGAYTSALITLNGLPFLLGLFLGMVLSALFALLIALPTPGLRDDYWAIVSIAAAETLRLFINNERWLAEGPFGLRGIPRPLEALFGTGYNWFYLVLSLVCLAIVFIAFELLIQSPFGRKLRAIRESEAMITALGRSVFRYKIVTLMISGAVAGLAGSLYGPYLTFISPEHFAPVVTFMIWSMVIVGGSGNNLGVILGAFVITLFNLSTRFVKDWLLLPTDLLAALRTLSIGLLIVVFVLLRPQGLIPEKRRSLLRVTRESLVTERKEKQSHAGGGKRK